MATITTDDSTNESDDKMSKISSLYGHNSFLDFFPQAQRYFAASLKWYKNQKRND